MQQAKARQAWDTLAEEVLSGFREWRVQHPQATFKELESALDERWARARARVLADAAMRSVTSDLREQPAAARPVCPDCGGPMALAGQEERVVTTTYDQAIRLSRSATVCTRCHRRFFPPG